MRIDTDTYLWGVAKIVIDHKDVGSENQRTQIRFYDEHGEEGTAATLCVWGVGSMAARTMPKITLIENGVERELVPSDPVEDDDQNSDEFKRGMEDAP
jgi:hypothetical protein